MDHRDANNPTNPPPLPERRGALRPIPSLARPTVVVLVLMLFVTALTSCHDESEEAIEDSIRAQGLTGDSADEAMTFIQHIADDPKEAALDLAQGIVTLFIIVADEDISFEHKVELLGPALVPFWDCLRPTFGASLFDPSDVDFSRLNLSACESEIVQTFLFGAAGHLAGRIAVRADNLFDLRLRAADAEQFVNTSGELYGWADTLYQQGARRDLPLAFQIDRLGATTPYRRFAHASFQNSEPGSASAFDSDALRIATEPFRTTGFSFNRFAVPASTD